MATMIAITMGVVIFGHQTDLLTSSAWFSVGLSFSMILYFTSSYMSFFAGLILAIYTTSLWPLLFKRLISFPPHKVLPLAMVTMIFLIVLSAWVVAYNFVPGGVITRERTDVLLVLAYVFCGLGTCGFSVQQTEVKDQEDLPNNDKKEEEKVNFFGRVFRRLSTITEDPELEEKEEPPSVMKQVNMQMESEFIL